MGMFISANGRSEEVKQIFISQNGIIEEVKELYISQNGIVEEAFLNSQSALAWPTSPLILSGNYNGSPATATFNHNVNGSALWNIAGIIGSGNWGDPIPVPNPGDYMVRLTNLSRPLSSGSDELWLSASTARTWTWSGIVGEETITGQWQYRVGTDGTTVITRNFQITIFDFSGPPE